MTDDIVARLRDGKNWLNGGACCGDVDDAECCAAPACIFGEALKQFYEAADEIERLTQERDEAREARDATRDGARVNTAAIRKAVELAQEYKSRADDAEAKVAKLREVLRPFGDVAEHDIGDDETEADMFRPTLCNHAPRLSVGDLRRARAVLQETETKGE